MLQKSFKERVWLCFMMLTTPISVIGVTENVGRPVDEQPFFVDQRFLRAAVQITQRSFQNVPVNVAQAEQILAESLNASQIVGETCPVGSGGSGDNFCLLQQFRFAQIGRCAGQDRHLGVWGISHLNCSFENGARSEVEVRYGFANLEMGFGFGATYRMGAAFLVCHEQKNCTLWGGYEQFSQKGVGFSGSRCGGGFFSFFVNRVNALFLFGSQFGLGGQVGTQTALWRWVRR